MEEGDKNHKETHTQHLSLPVTCPPLPNITMLCPGHGNVPTEQKFSARKPSAHRQRDIWCFGPLHMSLASLGDAWLSSLRSKNKRRPTVVMEGEGGRL